MFKKNCEWVQLDQQVEFTVPQGGLIIRPYDDLKIHTTVGNSVKAVWKGTVKYIDGSDLKLVVKQPESEGGACTLEYAHGGETVAVKYRRVSFDVYIPDTIFDLIKIEMTSGDLEGDVISAKNVVLSIQSGDIDVDAVEGNNINIAAVSGDISSTITVKDEGSVNVSTVSGDITSRIIFCNGGDIKLTAESGDINVAIKSANDVTLNANSNSGDINIRPLGIGHDLLASSSSGDVRVAGGCETATLKGKVSTVSGDIRIG